MKILQILNDELYENKEFKVTTLEELENKVTKYLEKEYSSNYRINKIMYKGAGTYIVVGISFNDIQVVLLEDCKEIEFLNSTKLKNNIYVIDNNKYDLNKEQIEELDKYSIRKFNKHCVAK